MIRCSYCGKFIGYNGYWSYTPFGSCADLEPPDPVDICQRCYNKIDEQGFELIKKVSWIPLCFIEPLKYE